MPIKFAAKKIGWSQSDKGFVIRLLVAPDDDWMEAANAPLGSPFGVVMVPIDPETGVRTDASPGADPPPRSPDAGQQRGQAGKPRKHWNEMSRAQRAGILCSDQRFRKWFGAEDEEHAATMLRFTCGVSSRSLLDTDEIAAKRFDAVTAEYRQFEGLEAEQRA